jgi:hypothetical protein
MQKTMSDPLLYETHSQSLISKIEEDRITRCKVSSVPSKARAKVAVAEIWESGKALQTGVKGTLETRREEQSSRTDAIDEHCCNQPAG